MAPETGLERQIPAYDGAVFISYARADDEKPPGDDKARGWVTFFWDELRWELTNAGVHQAKLWLDRYEIERDEKFTEKIEEALRCARLFLPILSPNWVQRKYCQEELAKFVELRQGSNPSDDIVLVKKRAPLSDAVPEVLRDREGFQFFREEPSGKLREFYWRGLQDNKAYFDVLKEMADRIADRLMVRAGPIRRGRSVTPSGRTIYLAAPADELRDAWLRLANDLRESGNVVVPSEGRLPDTLSSAEAAISDLLSKADLSVHFLGESEGGKPDGSEETLVRLQLRLAREHSSRPKVLWAPKWVPGRQERMRDPFEVVRRFGGMSSGEEVYAEEVTDLSQWLRERLHSAAPSPNAAVSTLLVVGASRNDDGLVRNLASRLQSGQIVVRAVFAGEALPSGLDVQSPAVALVPWGDADRASVDALLDRLAALGLQITVLSLPGFDEAAKNRFFRQGIYVEPLEALPPDRRAARELLARLEIIEGVDP